MCVDKTLNMDSCSKFCGNLEGIWGNPGEIPHIGWKIPGVYVRWIKRNQESMELIMTSDVYRRGLCITKTSI